MGIQQTLIKNFLKRFDQSSFDVYFETGDELHVGDMPPKFKVILHKPMDYKALLKSTSLALGESYMNGDLEIEGDLYTALNEILACKDQFSTHTGALKKILYTSSSAKNQKQEVSSHYDIGNAFYKLWLDPTLSYSCAYFKSDTDTLYDAQCNKVDYILKKLNLKEGMSLLDIGCGWGYLLIEAAKKYKIYGLGITLSKEQHDAFQMRIKEEHLEEYIQVKLMDYRDLEKTALQFDRVVSVGMLEHVGRDNYNLFFKNVNAILKPKGVFLLHYISGYIESPGDPWIKKYIFPGGMIPSLREIINLSGDFHFAVRDVESLRQHYVKTLLCWYDNYEKHLPEIEAMFDEKFVRMWRMYLCSCAATFNNGVVDLHQILFTKGVNNELPLTRDYMYDC